MTSAPRAESGSAMATHGVRCSPCIWGPQESACRGDPSHNYPTMTDSPYTTILRLPSRVGGQLIYRQEAAR